MRPNLSATIENTLRYRLSKLSKEGRERINIDRLTSVIAAIVEKSLEIGPDGVEYVLSDQSNASELESIGINKRKMRQLVEASGFGITNLKERITNIALSIKDKLVSEQTPDGCWNYLLLGDDENQETSNAWITASCLYALWKVDEFVSTDKLDKQKSTQKLGIEWLFNEALVSINGSVGWNNQSISILEKSKNEVSNSSDSNKLRTPMLHDTAYVLNILIRMRPESNKDYESILRWLCSLAQDDHWPLENGAGIDLPGTCYALRLLSNYLERYKRRPEKFQDIELLRITNKLIKNVTPTIILGQLKDGSWPNQFGLSSQVNTALAVHALRSTELNREFPSITRGCAWLLENLSYYDGSWCWVNQKGEGIIEKSIRDSAIVVSALLKASRYSKFNKAESVILWLLKEVNKGRLDKHVDLATALCAFADYLRAFTEPGFFPYLSDI